MLYSAAREDSYDNFFFTEAGAVRKTMSLLGKYIFLHPFQFVVNTNDFPVDNE